MWWCHLSLRCRHIRLFFMPILLPSFSQNHCAMAFCSLLSTPVAGQRRCYIDSTHGGISTFLNKHGRYAVGPAGVAERFRLRLPWRLACDDTHLHQRAKDYLSEETAGDKLRSFSRQGMREPSFSDPNSAVDSRITTVDTRTPRMYLGDASGALQAGQFVELSQGQAHYIVNVMRLKDGSRVRVFDGASGEFLATVSATAKSGGGRAGKGKARSGGGPVTLCLDRLIRKQPCRGTSFGSEDPSFDNNTHEEAPTAPAPDVDLLFAPIRKQRLKVLVEKAVEVGASRLVPVLTARTQRGCAEDASASSSLEKLRLIAVEAAEQSERMTVPHMESTAVELASLLLEWQHKIETRVDDRTMTYRTCASSTEPQDVPGVPAGSRCGSDTSTVASGREFSGIVPSQAGHPSAGTSLLTNDDPPKVMFVCKERDKDAPPLLDALKEFAREQRGQSQQPLAGAGGYSNTSISSDGAIRSAIFVGPEGGFAPDEIEAMSACSFVRFVSLGPSVLRAETAVVYALSCWSAFWVATEGPA
ncbi:unnamed protein product [Sphacelaria rigidula]